MTELLNHLETVAVLVFLVSSMAAMGLTLTPRAIAAPLRNVRFVLLALALNFVLAPACAWLLTLVIPLDRGHAAGLMLLGGSHRSVLSLATTARNFGAALAPAENCFNDPKVTVMIIVGAIVCLLVSFAAAGWVRRGTASISA